jgi:hypothetical protein
MQRRKENKTLKLPQGFGVRWLAGNGADTAFGRAALSVEKRCVPSPLTHRSPKRFVFAEVQRNTRSAELQFGLFQIATSQSGDRRSDVKKQTDECLI